MIKSLFPTLIIVLTSCLLIFLFTTLSANAMTVKEAYESIPHRQTTYQSHQSTLPRAEAQELNSLFALTDQATRLRVKTLAAFTSGQNIPPQLYNQAYETIIKEMKRLEVSGKLREARNLIIAAVIDQRDVFNEWADATTPVQASYSDMKHNKRVLSAHRKLLKAFGAIMKAYPGETDYNKRAFFDHLCALDFI